MIDPNDIIQSRPMQHFAFTTAASTPRTVMVPVEAGFFVEDCGAYRKIRFKCAIDGPGVEVQMGGQVTAVHTLDVSQSKRCILDLVKCPVSPLAWWDSFWRQAGPIPVVADRLLKILGKPHLVRIEAQPGTIVATDLEDIQASADQYLAGIDYTGWDEEEVVFEILVNKEGQNYPAQIRVLRSG